MGGTSAIYAISLFFVSAICYIKISSNALFYSCACYKLKLSCYILLIQSILSKHMHISRVNPGGPLKKKKVGGGDSKGRTIIFLEGGLEFFGKKIVCCRILEIKNSLLQD